MSHSTIRTDGVSLRELLPKSQFFGASNFHVQSCCSDSEKVQSGDIYFAIIDSDKDGHQGINQAISRGAAGIVAERFVVANVPLCVVDDTRVAYGNVCQSLVGNPTQSMCVIGVSGTNGKTTTAFFIKAILKEAGLRCGLSSSLGNFDGHQTSDPYSESTKAPHVANQLLRMRANHCDVAILELPSTLLAQRSFEGVKLDAAVYTNIRKDHLDFHATPKNYRRAKSRLLKMLKPGGFSVINADDPTSFEMLDRLDIPTITV